MNNKNGIINGLCEIGLMGVNVVVVDQSGQSDSNSEISAAESVATNRSNITVSWENENHKKKKKIASLSVTTFIDFLGVGAC